MKLEFDGNLSLFLPLMFCFEGETQNHLKHSSECDIVSKSHQKNEIIFIFIEILSDNIFCQSDNSLFKKYKKN